MVCLAGLAGPIALADTPPASDASSASVPVQSDIRVQVVAETSAVIGAPMSGRLTQFPLRDGDRFKQGDILARFACGELQGSLAKAQAIRTARQAALNSSRKLDQLGSSSILEGQLAEAAAAEAEADVETAEAMAAHCTVAAPFSGRVASVAARAFQFVSAGAPLLEILDDQTLGVEMILPSSWLSTVKPGSDFKIAVSETGKTYDAQLTRLSGKVDAVSQSVKAYARITGPTADLLAGMSGRAFFAQPATH